MFDTVEKHRGFFKILLALIALSFVTFTAHSFSQSGGDYIAKIGDHLITERDLDSIIRNNNLQADANMRKEVYQSLLQQAYLVNGAEAMSMSVSQDVLKKMIMAQPAFQENGVFSQQKYNEYLQRANQSEAMLADNLKKDFYLRNLATLVGSSGMAADSQIETLLKIYHSTYTVQAASFPLSQYTGQVQADDAKVEAFYQKNQKHYIQPLAVKFSYVRVSAADLAAAQTVSDAEVAAAQGASDAAAVRQSLKLDKAVRALPVVKENMADAALNQSTDLSGVAKEAGVAVQHHNEWMTREAAQKAGMPAAVVEALFSDEVLKQRFNSDAIEANGTIWVVRADDVRPEKAMNFAEVKAQVKQDYIAEQERVLAEAAAADAFAKLQKGESVTLPWSAEGHVALSEVPPSDVTKFIEAKPQTGKPAYILHTNLPVPVITRINTVTAPQNDPKLLAQTKTQLAQVNTTGVFEDYLRYLQRTVKNKQGRQKISDE